MSTEAETADQPSQPDASALLQRLSPARMKPYLAAVDDDKTAAMDLYLWNCAAGAALWESLGHVEVAIRRAVDVALTQRHERLKRDDDDWLWHSDVARELGSRSQEDIEVAHDRAKGAAERHNYVLTTDHVVAELNFGFWRFLFAKQRENCIGSAIRGAFPNAPAAVRGSDLSDLNRIVSRLYDLRNRIAHHEPIWWTHLQYRHDEVLRILGYIDTDLRGFVAAQSRFPAVYESKPAVACTGIRPNRSTSDN